MSSVGTHCVASRPRRSAALPKKPNPALNIEVECQLLLARDVQYLPGKTHHDLETEVQRIRRMLIRLI